MSLIVEKVLLVQLQPKGLNHNNSIDMKTNLIDPRDNNEYSIVKIGSQIVMAENLAYKPNSGNFWVFGDNQNNVKKYGYLYDWLTAKTIAPVGWHLPSKFEWETMFKFLGGQATAVYDAIKVGGISGFNAVLGGYRYSAGTFNEISCHTGLCFSGYYAFPDEIHIYTCWGKTKHQDFYPAFYNYTIHFCFNLLSKSQTILPRLHPR